MPVVPGDVEGGPGSGNEAEGGDSGDAVKGLFACAGFLWRHVLDPRRTGASPWRGQGGSDVDGIDRRVAGGSGGLFRQIEFQGRRVAGELLRLADARERSGAGLPDAGRTAEAVLWRGDRESDKPRAGAAGVPGQHGPVAAHHAAAIRRGRQAAYSRERRHLETVVHQASARKVRRQTDQGGERLEGSRRPY